MTACHKQSSSMCLISTEAVISLTPDDTDPTETKLLKLLFLLLKYVFKARNKDRATHSRFNKKRFKSIRY